jgi:hypothetical protein
MVDDNPEAVSTMRSRLAPFGTSYVDADGTELTAAAEMEQGQGRLF